MRVAFYTERVVDQVDKKMARPLATELGAQYAREVKKLMINSPASGRIYRRGTVTHRASKAGEPPAPDTGDLQRSVVFNVRKTTLGWVAEVGSRLRYALFLEFGAAKGIKNAGGRIESVRWILFPRPSWGPALDKVRRNIPETVARFRR
jgi:hypothetical protein